MTEATGQNEREYGVDYLKGIPLFAKLPLEDIKAFAQAATIRYYKKGQVVHHEEDVADKFYVVKSGWVKLAHSAEDGSEVILGMQTADSMVGEQCAFMGRYSSTMQIAEDAELMIFPAALLRTLFGTSLQLAHNILDMMLQHQRRNELQIIHYQLYSAPQRIGCFLLKLSKKEKLKDGLTLKMPYDKSYIASVLGMKAATFSRALNTLRQETGIQIAGATVKFASLKRLMDYVGNCYSQTHYRNYH